MCLHSHQKTAAPSSQESIPYIAHILVVVVSVSSIHSMMPRRDRRSGVRFIEDGRDRSLTYFKRRSGLFKAASDLSTLTGARVAVVLESESGRFSSFGTPEASPIVDAFLLGSAPTDLDTSEAQKASITNLQNEVFQLEKDKTMEDKRKKENMVRTSKKIQEASNSKVAKFVYGNIEDLDAPELFDMYRELSRVKQEIDDRLPTLLLHESKAAEAGGRLRDPSLLQPTWWRSMAPPPQAATPPAYPPWAPLQACFQQHPWSSTSPPVLAARSGSSLPNSLAPHTPPFTSSVQFQAPRTPAAMEAHNNPYSYHHIRGIDINGSSSSHPFSLSPILSSSSTTPQQSSLQTTPPSDDSSPLSLSPQVSSPLHLHVGSSSQQLLFSVQSYNSVQPPQNYENNAGSPMMHSQQLFYNSLSPGLNVELGNIDSSGGTQAGGGHSERFGLSSPQQSDDGFDGVMPKSFSAGESSGGGGGGAGGNLGGSNFPWY